jgi:hypothetical protein
MTLRHRIEITDAAGNVLADVVDDEVSVLAGRWLAARFHELEVAIRDETAPELIHTLPERSAKPERVCPTRRERTSGRSARAPSSRPRSRVGPPERRTHRLGAVAEHHDFAATEWMTGGA